MLHLESSTPPARPRRMMAAVLAFVLVSLLVVAAPIGVAAKGPSITLTADQQTVNAGDQVTLKIKLQNVTNATLNGAALPAGKDQLDKKVLVCATTTYTVAALPTDGGPKISQALTITANGTTTKAACLPDLVAAALTISQSYDPKDPKDEQVRIDYTIANRGQTPVKDGTAAFYLNGQYQASIHFDLKPGDAYSSRWDQIGHDGDVLAYSMVVDPNNKIVEADKTNNMATANLTVVKGRNPVGMFTDKVDKSGQGPDILKLIKP
jgi:uncharacterized repeat protein (TIGR01451 family)